MRILFDQGTRPFRYVLFLPNHSVETAFERGWQMLENGQLLEAAEREGYAVLVNYRSKSPISTESGRPQNCNRRSAVNIMAPYQAKHENYSQRG